MPLEVVQGNSPIILSLPHTGTNMQRGLVQRLNERERWHTAPDQCLDRLVGGLHQDINLLRANFHRYLSDPELSDRDGPLKPRKGIMGVVPLVDNDGHSIWHNPPNSKEAAIWRSMYYAPYHAAIATQIARVRACIGHVVLVTCRTERNTVSTVSKLEPADVNICTYMGASCAIDLPVKLHALFQSHDRFSVSLNGQVDSGWSTRRYGRPGTNVHAFDLVVNEASYIDTEQNPGQIDTAKAEPLRQILSEAFELIAQWSPN